MFRKYTFNQNIVMCWRMLNSRAYIMARRQTACPYASLKSDVSAAGTLTCHLPGSFLKDPGIFFAPGSSADKCKINRNLITKKGEIK